ncbi:molecular chaperone DnaJ [Kribbia dieselivorans]|uniref:molecular chaperone DnaJ n=1 Tax=Kribbia dieselivorans TaxID=331526 RepID=UPI0008390950|nr:molecular chaperone DnaJ [Kribbia dieselivorans]
MNDYYADLGVARDATADQIKTAYRRKARTLHPDVNPGPEAEEAFKKVSQAYDVLGDEDKRRAYDQGRDPYGDGASAYGQGFSFSDIMEQFFGQAAGGSSGPRPRQQRGQDGLVRLDVDLEHAVFGGSRDLTIETAVACGTCHGDGCQPGTSRRTCDLCGGRGEIQQVQRSFLGQVMTSRPCGNCRGYGDVIPNPCFECSGQGRVRTRRTMTVKIPAGVDSGTRIHLSGEGEVGPYGGPQGDLYVELLVNPHATFTRRGDDLHASLELPFTAAALGATVAFDTLDGQREVSIAPGTQPNETITLSGLGVGHLRAHGRGDLIIHADVRTPTRLTDQQEDLLRQLAELRGEEQPEGTLSTHEPDGFFSKLRGAFKGR